MFSLVCERAGIRTTAAIEMRPPKEHRMRMWHSRIETVGE
jgi:hypothetical protein